MTILVGIETSSGAIVGTDAFSGGEGWRDIQDRPKYTQVGNFLVATAGHVRACQIAEATRLKRKRGPKEDDLQYLLKAFVTPVMEAQDDADVPVDDFCALIVFEGRVYALDEEGGLMRSAWGYSALGAGYDLALGSLASTEELSPRERVERALKAAKRHCNQCAGKSYITEVPREM